MVTNSRAGILWEGEDAFKSIKEAFSGDGFKIIMVHGGEEWQNTPSLEQKSLYRNSIDLGADVVFGAHPHILQGVEIYNNGFIAYSLGNFIFPGMQLMPYAEESMLISLGIYNGNICFINFFPIQMNQQKVKLSNSDKVLDRFLNLTIMLNEK